MVRNLLAVQAHDPYAALLSLHLRCGGKRDALRDAALRDECPVARVWGIRCASQILHRQDWKAVSAAVRDSATKKSEKELLKVDGMERVVEKVMQEAVRALEGGSHFRETDVLTWSDTVISKLELRDTPGIDIRKGSVGEVVKVQASLLGHGERLILKASPTTSGSTRILLWPRKEGTPWKDVGVSEAVKLCASRYFTTYAPASEKDFRYWIGISAKASKKAVKMLQEAGSLEAVRCTDNKLSLFVHKRVTAEVQTTMAPADADWRVHLLSRYEPLLLAYENKI